MNTYYDMLLYARHRQRDLKCEAELIRSIREMKVYRKSMQREHHGSVIERARQAAFALLAPLRPFAEE